MNTGMIVLQHLMLMDVQKDLMHPLWMLLFLELCNVVFEAVYPTADHSGAFYYAIMATIKSEVVERFLLMMV